MKNSKTVKMARNGNGVKGFISRVESSHKGHFILKWFYGFSLPQLKQYLRISKSQIIFEFIKNNLTKLTDSHSNQLTLGQTTIYRIFVCILELNYEVIREHIYKNTNQKLEL